MINFFDHCDWQTEVQPHLEKLVKENPDLVKQLFEVSGETYKEGMSIKFLGGTTVNWELEEHPDCPVQTENETDDQYFYRWHAFSEKFEREHRFSCRELWQMRRRCHIQNRSLLMFRLAKECCPLEEWRFASNRRHSTIVNKDNTKFFDILVSAETISLFFPELFADKKE